MAVKRRAVGDDLYDEFAAGLKSYGESAAKKASAAKPKAASKPKSRRSLLNKIVGGAEGVGKFALKKGGSALGTVERTIEAGATFAGGALDAAADRYLPDAVNKDDRYQRRRNWNRPDRMIIGDDDERISFGKVLEQYTPYKEHVPEKVRKGVDVAGSLAVGVMSAGGALGALSKTADKAAIKEAGKKAGKSIASIEAAKAAKTVSGRTAKKMTKKVEKDAARSVLGGEVQSGRSVVSKLHRAGLDQAAETASRKGARGVSKETLDKVGVKYGASLYGVAIPGTEGIARAASKVGPGRLAKGVNNAVWNAAEKDTQGRAARVLAKVDKSENSIGTKAALDTGQRHVRQIMAEDTVVGRRAGQARLRQASAVAAEHDKQYGAKVARMAPRQKRDFVTAMEAVGRDASTHTAAERAAITRVEAAMPGVTESTRRMLDEAGAGVDSAYHRGYFPRERTEQAKNLLVEGLDAPDTHAVKSLTIENARLRPDQKFLGRSLTAEEKRTGGWTVERMNATSRAKYGFDFYKYEPAEALSHNWRQTETLARKHGVADALVDSFGANFAKIPRAERPGGPRVDPGEFPHDIPYGTVRGGPGPSGERGPWWEPADRGAPDRGNGVPRHSSVFATPTDQAVAEYRGAAQRHWMGVDAEDLGDVGEVAAGGQVGLPAPLRELPRSTSSRARKMGSDLAPAEGGALDRAFIDGVESDMRSLGAGGGGELATPASREVVGTGERAGTRSVYRATVRGTYGAAADTPAGAEVVDRLYEGWTKLGKAGKDADYYGKGADEVQLWEKLNELKQPGGWEKFMKPADMLMAHWKQQRLFTPGYHVRNYVGAVFTNYVRGVSWESYGLWSRMDHRLQKALSENGGDLERALQVLPEGHIREAVGAAYRTGAVHTGSESVQYADALSGQLGDGRGLLGARLRSVDPTSLQNAAYKGSHKVANRIENHVRGAQFLDTYLKNGGDAREALMRTIETHYDGDWISPFEKDVMRRAAPFYTWTRQNLPAMLEAAAMNPMRTLGVLGHAKEVVEGGVPDEPLLPGFIRDNPSAIRTPLTVPLYDKVKKEGYDARVTLMPDLPISDVLGIFQDPRSELAARSNPVLQQLASVLMHGGPDNTPYDLQYKSHYKSWPEDLGGAKGKIADVLGLAENKFTGDTIDRFAPLADIADRMILPWLGREKANPRDFDKRVTGTLSSGAGVTSVTESRGLLRAEEKARGKKGKPKAKLEKPNYASLDAAFARYLMEGK